MWSLKNIPNVNFLHGFCIKFWPTLYPWWLVSLDLFDPRLMMMHPWTWLVKEILVLIPRTLQVVWRTLGPSWWALGYLITWHAFGHLPSPPRPWTLQWLVGHCRYGLTYHWKDRKPTTWTLDAYDDVRVWMDPITLDEDGTPLQRRYGALTQRTYSSIIL